MTWPQQYLQEHFIWHFGSNSKFWSLIKVKCLEVWACSSTNFDPMFVWTKYDWVYLTQKLGFKCTSSSYQLHCPPCNIMPPGVVNWNLRKESRHSRNFFRGYNCYFANSKFWNQQTINQSNLPEFGTCKGTGQDIVRESIERQK